MSWLRKLVQVFAVIGLAALSSIPFKRNAPQSSSAQGPSTDSRVASDSANSDVEAASASASADPSKSSAAMTTSIPSATAGAPPFKPNDAANSTVGAALNSETDAGKSRAGAVSSSGGTSVSSPATTAIPPTTSYGVADSASASGAKVSDFSSSDRPLPEADSSADRPAVVARLEIRAPRIVGDPPRDVRIRDDEPVPAMGSSFQPLWQPEDSKRRIAEPDGKAGGGGGQIGPSSGADDAQRSGKSESAPSAGGGDQAAPLKHRVAFGDSLESLAQQYLGDGSRGEAIYELNRERIADRFSLPVGVELSIPKRSE